MQIDGVELSTEIHVKKVNQKSYPKSFYPNSTLLILPDFITVVQPYLICSALNLTCATIHYLTLYNICVKLGGHVSSQVE